MHYTFCKPFVCILLLILSTIMFMPLYGQNKNEVTISGYVTDVQTRESLIGVNIFNSSDKTGTVTNNSGYYSLTVPAGDLRITYSYVGYISEEKVFHVASDTTINIGLREQSAKELNTVVVTADRRSELKSIEVGRTRLSMQDLSRMPSFMGEADLIKYAQLLPGVSKGYEGFSGMIVRGGNSDENLYLVDGNPMYNVNHLFGLFSTFNSDAVKSAEIYKGSFPARFGGRLSSVMDVHTNDGNMKEYHGTFNIGLISSRISFEGPILKDRTSFHVSFRRTYLDLVSKPFIWIINKQEDSDVDFGYHFFDANVKLNHKFNDKHRIYFQLYSGYDILGASSKDKYQSGNYDYFKFNMGWGNILSSLGWDYAISPKLFAHTTLLYSQYDSKIKNHNEDKEGNNISSFKYKLKSGINDIGVRTDWDFHPNNSHFVRFGGVYTFHTFRPNAEKIDTKGGYEDDVIGGGLIKVKDDVIHTHETSLYLEDEISLVDWLSLNLGGRATLIKVQGKSYLSAEPRASFRAMLNDRISIKGAYSQMVQSVHLLQGSVLALPTDLWVPATSKLKPMVSKQSSLGIYWANKGYEISAEGYYKTMDHLLSYKDGESVILSDQSWQDRVASGEGRAYGVELMLKKNQGPFTGWISYTLSWANRIYPGGEVNRGKRFPDRFDNRHKLNIVGIWKISPKVDLSATWSLSSGNMATLPLEYYTDINGKQKKYLKERNNYRMPLYHRLDLNVNVYRPKKKGRMGIWSFGLYNAYVHQNSFMVYLDEETDGFMQGADVNRAKLKSITFFPIIPSISYTYKF